MIASLACPDGLNWSRTSCSGLTPVNSVSVAAFLRRPRPDPHRRRRRQSLNPHCRQPRRPQTNLARASSLLPNINLLPPDLPLLRLRRLLRRQVLRQVLRLLPHLRPQSPPIPRGWLNQ